jgi:hypothetical protein
MSTRLRHTLRLPLLTAAISFGPLLSTSMLGQAPATPLRDWERALRQAVDEARAGLRSDKPNQVAWGAFRAAEYRLFDLVPDLVTKLAAPPAAQDREAYAVRAALLDSAVRLDAAVPAPMLRRFWKDFPVQSAILFAKAIGRRDVVLLDLLTSATDFRWFALANLLLQSRPNGFAIKAITPIRLNLFITVSQQGTVSSGGGGSAGAVGDGIGINPPGYPPHATYRFESGPWPGHVVLSTGPHDVYYSRTVSYGWQFGASEAYIGGPSGADRLRYVQAHAFPEQEPFDHVRQVGERHERVKWEGDDALRRRVEDLRAEMLAAYRGFLASLVAAHRLTASEAKSLAHPPIDVRIVDAREKSVPLPVIK